MLCHGCRDRSCDEFRCTGMGVVRFDDDGASGCQCGRGVASRNREGKREVAGSEDDDRSERHHAQANITAGQWLAIGYRRIDPCAVPAPFTQDGGKQAQLSHGASALTEQSCTGQTAFGRCTVDQFVTEADDVLGDRVEELRAPLRGGLPVGVECVVCDSGCVSNVLRSRVVKRRREGGSGVWVDRDDRCACAGAGNAADQEVSGERGMCCGGHELPFSASRRAVHR